MPGSRDRNLRSGDLHEDLGLLLLKGLALVAPVPRQEDVGTDAFATLVRLGEERRLIPDLSFVVQLKSASITSVLYPAGPELEWIATLEAPLFIGRVDLMRASIELFTTLPLHHVLLEQPYKGLELLIDRADEIPTVADIRRVNIGPAVYSWTLSDISRPDFVPTSHEILRPHVETLRRNRLLRGIQSQIVLRWQTGHPPEVNGEMMLVSPENDVADALRDMIPHVRRLLMDIWGKKRYADFPAVLALVDLMRKRGADPDPDNALLMLVGSCAEGPEISIENAILIRSAFQPGTSVDLSRLPVTDQVLSKVPETKTEIALVDTQITDGAVPVLLSRPGLRRINLDGTQISDEGAHALLQLPALEWMSIRRTRVTLEGLKKMRSARPQAEIIS